MNEDFPFDLNTFLLAFIIATISLAFSNISLLIGILIGGILILIFCIFDIWEARRNDKS